MYLLPRLARQEGCDDMSLTVSSSTIDGPAGTQYGSGAAGLLRGYTGRASSRTMGRYYKPDHGPHYEPDHNCAIVPRDLRASDRRC